MRKLPHCLHIPALSSLTHSLYSPLPALPAWFCTRLLPATCPQNRQNRRMPRMERIGSGRIGSGRPPDPSGGLRIRMDTAPMPYLSVCIILSSSCDSAGMAAAAAWHSWRRAGLGWGMDGTGLSSPSHLCLTLLPLSSVCLPMPCPFPPSSSLLTCHHLPPSSLFLSFSLLPSGRLGEVSSCLLPPSLHHFYTCLHLHCTACGLVQEQATTNRRKTGWKQLRELVETKRHTTELLTPQNARMYGSMYVSAYASSRRIARNAHAGNGCLPYLHDRFHSLHCA